MLCIGCSAILYIIIVYREISLGYGYNEIASRSFMVIDNHLSKQPAPDIREVHLVNRRGRNVEIPERMYICKQHVDWTF